MSLHGVNAIHPAAIPQTVGKDRRILICSAGIPHERDGASVVLFYHYIARLRREGYRILHILLLPGPNWAQSKVDEYTGKMSDSEDPSRFRITAVRAPQFYREGRWSHELVPSAAEQVAEAARGFEPDLILAFDLLAAWTTKRVETAHRLVWLGDLNFQTILYHALYSARENLLKSIHIPFNWMGAQAWKRIYRDALTGADRVVVASASSVDQLARIGTRATYEPYPWPEESEGGLTNGKRALPDVPTFVFFGSLGGLGSRSALHFVTRKIFPLLQRLWGEGGFRVLVAGRGELPEWAARAFSGWSEIESLGYVEDLDELLGSCHAVLAPIDVPIGNRSRILTAMAKRVLVIAHANAALGNSDLEDGSTCYLAANAIDFVDRMRLAVEDRASAETIIDQAYRRYRERFGTTAAGDRMVMHIQRIFEPAVSLQMPRS